MKESRMNPNSDTPTPNVMAAAEEIAEIAAQDPCNSLEGDDCAGDCKACLTERFAAIIARHCGDTEKVLRVAAKWAREHCREGYEDLLDFCPLDGGGDCPKGEGFKFSIQSGCPYSETSSIDNCWLEYWKKEAERDQL